MRSAAAVGATAGGFYLYSESYFRFVPYNMSAAELQTALEGELGAGNIEVTGGPGDASGSKPYVITFAAALVISVTAPSMVSMVTRGVTVWSIVIPSVPPRA